MSLSPKPANRSEFLKSAPCRLDLSRRASSWASRAGWFCCVLAAMLAACPPMAHAQAVDRATQLDQQRKQRANQYKMIQQNFASMPALSAGKIDDVLRLKMEGRSLTLVSPLTEADHGTGSFRVESDAFKGPTTAQVSLIALGRIGAGRGAAAPTRMFTLISYDFPNPDELDTLSVQSYPAYLQIYRQSQIGAGGFRMIRLVQQRSPAGQAAAAGQGSVQLFVNESGDAVAAGATPRNFSIQAGDFQSLVRGHGHEADEFIRPLLRQIAQESVLTPDENVAWQVLSDRWQPDPQAARKVRQLLPTLNDADFHARDNALVEIQNMGKLAAAVLLHLDRTRLTPEQNLAIDRALAPYGQLSPKEAARLHDDANFLLDCLYGDDHEIRVAALERLKQVTGKDLPFNLDAGDADRSAAVSVLRRQLAPAGIVKT